MSTNIQIEKFTINCSKTKSLLGINIHDKLKFDICVGSFCQKADRKLNALARIKCYMELP